MASSSIVPTGTPANVGLPGEMSASSAVPTKILIVDDEEDILDEVSECLDEEGYTWATAQNAEEAIKIVENDHDIGIVVTDIRMPGMDGLDLSRKLIGDCAKSRDLFVIVVTGHAGMREAIEALQIGAEDFLTKPISPDHLLHSVKRAEEMITLRSTERQFTQRLEKEVKEKTASIRKLARDLEERNAELKQKNDDLSIINRLKDEFLQMISHELNTPLNAISGFAQLLQQNKTVIADPSLSISVDSILAGSDRLTKVVSAILTLSDITSGRMTPDCSAFMSNDLCDSVESGFAILANDRGATLQQAHTGQPFEIVADSNLLTTAINCLLDNAIKFGDGPVVFGLRQDRDRDQEIACISVSDSGEGMTEEQVAVALEPLRQVDGAADRNAEGIGMGLALAKGIAELHGGQLTIESALNKGTTVTLLVPKGNLMAQ